MADKKIIPVAGQFIERGIEKYKGVVDEYLLAQLKRASMDLIPYKFADNRYLLVEPNANIGLLYPDIESVYERLVLD